MRFAEEGGSWNIVVLVAEEAAVFIQVPFELLFYNQRKIEYTYKTCTCHFLIE